MTNRYNHFLVVACHAVYGRADNVRVHGTSPLPGLERCKMQDDF